MSFDYNAIYYRVVGTEGRSGYYYDDEEMQEMETSKGLLTAAHPKYEFDSIARIGSWLHLGRAVQQLRIPPTATVITNNPLSQGGCYTWSASSVELLGIISFAELMQSIEAAGVGNHATIVLEQYEFPKPFTFPRSLRSIVLDQCTLHTAIRYPQQLKRMSLSNCRFENAQEIIKALPPVVEERWEINNQELAQIHLSLNTKGEVSLSDCYLDTVQFPEELHTFSAYNCLFAGRCTFPQQITNPPYLLKCTFEQPWVYNKQ
jgi:hypothetical protein